MKFKTKPIEALKRMSDTHRDMIFLSPQVKPPYRKNGLDPIDMRFYANGKSFDRLFEFKSTLLS